MEELGRIGGINNIIKCIKKFKGNLKRIILKVKYSKKEKEVEYIYNSDQNI